jgi:regulator of replication initiation timing
MPGMRRTLFFLVLVLGVGAGLGFYVEMRHAAILSAGLTEAQQKIKLNDEQLAAKNSAISALEEKNKILAAESESLRKKLKSPEVVPQVAANSGEAASGQPSKRADFGSQMSKMMAEQFMSPKASGSGGE